MGLEPFNAVDSDTFLVGLQFLHVRSPLKLCIEACRRDLSTPLGALIDDEMCILLNLPIDLNLDDVGIPV